MDKKQLERLIKCTMDIEYINNQFLILCKERIEGDVNDYDLLVRSEELNDDIWNYTSSIRSELKEVLEQLNEQLFMLNLYLFTLFFYYLLWSCILSYIVIL